MARGNLYPYRGGANLGTAGLGGGSLFDLHRQMNRLFDNLIDQGSAPPESGGGRSMLSGASMSPPAMEVHQDESHIEITAELPGVKEEDVDLSVEDGILALSGEKKSERQSENGYSERSYGRFERRITLPSNIDEEKCSADFRDGVLTITLPKAEEKNRARRIPLGNGQSRKGKQPGNAQADQDRESGSGKNK